MGKPEDSVNGIGITKDEPIKKKDGGKKAQPLKKEQPAEEATFEKPKLKKSETIKRAIEEPKLETVRLKSHAFEKSPQDNPEEMRTMIMVARGLDIQIDSKEEEKMTRKIVKKKKKKQPSTAEQAEEAAAPGPEPAEEVKEYTEDQETVSPKLITEKSDSPPMPDAIDVP